MGRPLNKRNFGPPTAGGNEIKVRFHNGTTEVDGYIVSQRSSRKFRCSDGSNEAVCKLVDKDEGSLLEGEMNIVVKDDVGTVTEIVKISAHKATVDTGGAVGWDFSASTTDGKVEMESIPSAVPVEVADGSFVIGTEYEITTVGTTTTWTEAGAPDGNLGTVFVATAVGSDVPGDGLATPTSDQGDDFV